MAVYDEALDSIEGRVRDAYEVAVAEMQAKLSAFLKRYAEENAEWKANVKAGKATQEEYDAWLRDQTTSETVMRQQLDALSSDLANAASIAQGIVNGEMPGVYSEAHAWSTYEIESGASIDTAYTLYNRDAVFRLLSEGEIQLPQASVDVAKEKLWDRQHLASAIAQGILQGETIEQIARRVAGVADMSKASAVRMARTCTIGASNAGSLDACKRARDMGVDVRKQWMATLDNRTRHSHRSLDGERVGLDEPFSNGLQYPGDPTGKASEVYNCRCTIVPDLPDFPDDGNAKRASKLGSMSYEEWKAGRAAERAAAYVLGRNLFQDSALLKSIASDYDGALEKVVQTQGFDGLPTVIGEEQLSGDTLYRGIRAPTEEQLAEHHDALIHGDWYYSSKYGGAMYGRGMYTASDSRVSDSYAGSGGFTEKMRLIDGAKVLTWGKEDTKMDVFNHLTGEIGDLSALREALLADDPDWWSERSVEKWGLDSLFEGEVTTAAAALGYDAVYIEDDGYYIILNRTALEIVG